MGEFACCRNGSESCMGLMSSNNKEQNRRNSVQWYAAGTCAQNSSLAIISLLLAILSLDFYRAIAGTTPRWARLWPV